MLTIENVNKVHQMPISRLYSIELILPTPYVYYFQLKNKVNQNIVIAELDREANQNGKYKLKLNNNSDYLTIKELKDKFNLLHRINGLMKC